MSRADTIRARRLAKTQAGLPYWAAQGWASHAKYKAWVLRATLKHRAYCRLKTQIDERVILMNRARKAAYRQRCIEKFGGRPDRDPLARARWAASKLPHLVPIITLGRMD